MLMEALVELRRKRAKEAREKAEEEARTARSSASSTAVAAAEGRTEEKKGEKAEGTTTEKETEVKGNERAEERKRGKTGEEGERGRRRRRLSSITAEEKGGSGKIKLPSPSLWGRTVGAISERRTLPWSVRHGWTVLDAAVQRGPFDRQTAKVRRQRETGGKGKERGRTAGEIPLTTIVPPSLPSSPLSPSLSSDSPPSHRFPFQLSVCYPPLRGSVYDATLLSHLLFYRSIGVEHFTLYSYEPSPVASLLLKRVAEEGRVASLEGRVDVVDWPSLRSFDDEGEIDVHYYGQQAAINDCVYRWAKRNTLSFFSFILLLLFILFYFVFCPLFSVNIFVLLSISK